MIDSLLSHFHVGALGHLAISCLWAQITYSQFFTSTGIFYEFICNFDDLVQKIN